MTKIQDLVNTLRTQYRTEFVIADLSETVRVPKKTVPKLGKIELFELGEVSTKIQCSSCAKYWPEELKLQLRTVFWTFERTETQDRGTI